VSPGGAGDQGLPLARPGAIAHDARMEKLPRKPYEKELLRLQGELVNMQEWVRTSGARLVVVFEGRDAAGKGGAIQRISEYLNPRICRVVALPAPTERERTQWYFQRYVPHMPAAGEIVLGSARLQDERVSIFPRRSGR
jgi:polyphosphate kinase 2 (PPK2 family)